ncbi:MAG: Rieske (2Fe-2S) protein [Planctomycetes bacterium]|nr:Rieske (2Fe-2S) protein [Planctomycetota bacterium]
MDSNGASRRGFLATLTLVLAGVPILGAIVASLRSGLAPARVEKPTSIPLCHLEELPKGDAILGRAVTFEMRRGPLVENVSRMVFVTRGESDGDYLAMLGECTHLRCPIQQRTVSVGGRDAPLRCPCHGGVFSRTGEVLAGPPRAPLRRLELEMPTDGADIVHVRGL